MRIISRDRMGRYQMIKEIITDPHLPCLLVDARLDADDPDLLAKLQLLCCSRRIWASADGAITPTPRGSPATNSLLRTKTISGWLWEPTCPFVRRSCGYVGATDGWQDLNTTSARLSFASAADGNIALIGELDLSKTTLHGLGLGFGNAPASRDHHAFSVARHSVRREPQPVSRAMDTAPLSTPTRSACSPATVARSIGAPASCSSRMKTRRTPGAMIASLSIPWGEVKGDEQLGGYHLVWTRDLVNSVTGLMAAGELTTRDARADLSRLLAATRRRLPAEFLDRRHRRTGPACSSTRFRSRSCWPGALTA